MSSHRVKLPKHFDIGAPQNKTPSEIFAAMTDLYAKACQKAPENGYIKAHSNPENIGDHILTFGWYLPHLKAGQKILDLGCHHAPDSSMVRAVFGNDVELFGCDVAEPGEIPVFHESIGLNYKKMRGHYTIPFDDGQFDTIIASGCMEHAALDFRLLEEAHRVLKTDGKLIITYLPNHWSVGEWIMRNVKKRDFHFRLYRLGATKQLLRHFGFHPIHGSTHYFFWERRLMLFGLPPNLAGLKTILSWIFPIHLFASCLKLVAIRRSSM
jgi:SAM-dependent methyltransferase